MSNKDEQKDENENNNKNDPTGKEIIDVKLHNPNKDVEKEVDIREPIIWSCFPLKERFWYSFCCKTSCCSDYKSEFFFSKECLQNQCKRDPSIPTSNKILSIAILKSGTLLIEKNIVHPFVRISIVNLKTGKYIQKSNFNEPCVSRTETNFTFHYNKTQNKMEYTSSPLDFIAPVSTCPFDLREKGESFAEWNEIFDYNEDAEYLLDSNNIIFFELLDFNLYFPLDSSEDCILPIAWGYLKPVGFSRTYIGKHKIQLYQYKMKRSKELQDAINKLTDYNRTPDVLYEFDWIRKTKYQTFLQIQLIIDNKPTLDDIKKHNYYYKRYLYSVFVPEGEEILGEILSRRKLMERQPTNEPTYYLKLKLLHWRRNRDETCRIPNKLIYKFNTAKLGCLTHEFSNNGRYIAAACTELSSETTIKIFNVEEGILKYHFKGHHQIIHHFHWSFDDLILISCSADNNVTLWKIPRDESNDSLNLEPLDNDQKFKLTSIFHPAYVYSCDIYPDNSQELMILATACFDGIVRLYAINLSFNRYNAFYSHIKTTCIKEIQISQNFADKDFFSKLNENLQNEENVKKSDKEKITLLEKTALDHRHPNTLVFDQTGQLYIGDSLGYIHIWELRIIDGIPKLNQIRAITHKELEHDTINKITIIPKQTKRLLIHSRDNCIRLLDLSTEKPRVIVRYFGSKCNKTNIKSTISPEGSYIFSGSEEGIPHIWQMESAIAVGTGKFECGFIDSVNDVSWNNCYHMTAISAFGQEYPLLVHVYEKEVIEIDKQEIKLKKDKKKKNDFQKIFENEEKDEMELIDEKEEDIYIPSENYLNPMSGRPSKFAGEFKARIENDVENK